MFTRGDPRGAGTGDLEALLQPTLARQGEAPALYSLRANVLVAFFGGVYATLLFSWLNTRKLGRVRQDAGLYLTTAVLWTATLAWFGHARMLGELPSWMLSEGGGPGRDFRLFGRVVALLVFGLIYARLRRYFKAAELAGMDAPSPWKPALIAIAISMVLTIVVVGAGAMLAEGARP